MTNRSRHVLLIGAFAALASTGCSRNAATGANQFSLISEAQEIEMGRANDVLVVASLGLYPDAALQGYVQQIGTRLAALTERPALPWTFRVVDDAAVNAFALPGGFVYVTRGLLAYVSSEAQLASVIGHEIGHVTARHSVTQLSRQQLSQFGLAIGSAVSPTIARYGSLAGAGLNLLFLKYSRSDEQQADDLGLRYMVRGSWDPHEMPDVFTMLERVGEASGGGRVPDWLSTHPSPSNRRAHIAQGIAALPPGYGTTVNRNAYLARLDNLVFGADPREGFFRGSLFLHPVMRFQLAFPAGWTTANERQSVSAVGPHQDAVVVLSAAAGSSAASAARAFFAEPGTSGSARNGSVGGQPAVAGDFTAAIEGGQLDGTVEFIEYGGGVIRVLAYATAARWPSVRSAAHQSLQSFAVLSDPSVLAAQPQRMSLITIGSPTTLTALARGRASGIPMATLAIINQVGAGTRLSSGLVEKWVVGPVTR